MTPPPFSVRWRARAIADMRRIERDLGAKSPQGAARMRTRILERVSQLEDFPEIGFPVPKRAGVRQLTVSGTPYVVFYRRDSHGAVNIAVFDGKQDRWGVSRTGVSLRC